MNKGKAKQPSHPLHSTPQHPQEPLPDNRPSSSSSCQPSQNTQHDLCESNSSTLLDLQNQPSKLSTDASPLRHPNSILKTPVTEPLPSPPTPKFPMPNSIIPLLLCLVCSNQLLHPTTLHCGHTVCSKHVQSPPTDVPPSDHPPASSDGLTLICPVKTCATLRTPSQPAPNIPPTSRVVYIPVAPPQRDGGPTPARQVTHIPDPKTDVTLTKVMSLISRAQDWLELEHRGLFPNEFVPLPDHDEDTDHSDHESELELKSDPPPSSSLPADTAPLHRRPRGSNASETVPQRPKKRRRHVSPSSGPTAQPGMDARARFEKELLNELTCEICFAMMYQPLTTPCQHSFCSKCLHRSLDHRNACPLCRQSLPGYEYFHDHPYNQVLLSIMLKAFPSLYAARAEAIEAEERQARLDTPIFICQLCFPGIPTFLHFYEPRYRLMLRRCLESPTPRFGMIMPPRAAPTGLSPDGEYGTMLEIRSVQMLPDGRSLVETWGSFRFRILERSSLDGYTVGRIERIDDFEEELDDVALAGEDDAESASPSPQASSSSSSPAAPTDPPTVSSIALRRPSPSTSFYTPSSEDLMAVCHDFLHQLHSGTAPWVVERLNVAYGEMPEDPAMFSFWICLVLPIDEHEKAKLLPIRSPRLRLRLVVHWIEQLNNNWWFSSGCVVI